MKIEHSGKATILFGLGATIIYLVMVLGTLRYLTDLAGALPFDLRPSGYTQADAEGLLEALGGRGRNYYLTRQIPLDTLYPALLALTLISALRWRSFRFGPTLMTKIGGALAILAATFDYLENLGISLMLLTGSGSDLALVTAISTATILKSALTTASVLALIVSLLLVLFSRMLSARSTPAAR
ncbi:hypothetical protein [Maritimibacter sp. UBA3975]|uniref:hypothetical protein n=1 Tax=Maritimibacter sp. UBA3975 TaxID=1946833 RepID=UPI000C0B4BC6|nr:hypothetical protein [Maritimibacter sp. UBA3975]MAM63199.1 hypothetical protein [Maritimibacter sp.]|tara:strand:- start:4623 stop:5174 length:552 start_codon:yes stop_codon:yes gene_type:complete